MKKFIGLLFLLSVMALGIPAQAQEKIFTNDIGMEFVLIPAGSFMMGFEGRESDEVPVHKVTISRPFYLGRYEVTQEQWASVMGNNPSEFENWGNPVERVSWDDVQVFIKKLNQKASGGTYRLPTEAEWEYAAGAGKSTEYFFGDYEGELGRYAWYNDNSGGKTHPVGQKQANPWGLYDIYGNVWEWVQDWYGEYRGGAVTDPKGPSLGSARVFRGGSWRNSAGRCRSATRVDFSPDFRDDLLGFRLAFSPGQ